MKIYKIALLLLLLPLVYIFAQDMPPADGDRNIDKIEQMENAKLIQVINLNEEKAVRFFARRKEYREHVRHLLEQRHKLISSLDEDLKGTDRDNSPFYKGKLESLFNIETDLVKEKKSFYRSINNILTLKQMLQLIVFEDKFRREVRETLMNRNRSKQN